MDAQAVDEASKIGVPPVIESIRIGAASSKPRNDVDVLISSRSSSGNAL